MTGWKQELLCSKTGEIRPLLANAILAFRLAPAWSGVLAYDEFAMQTVMSAPPPWESKRSWVGRPWTEHDDLLATNWLQQQDIGVPVSIVQQAVEAVARDACYHPVVDYLDGLEHDGVDRMAAWLTNYLGAASTAYHQEVGRLMLIGAVARIYEPGCKLDTVPILEGIGSKLIV
jgi:predicted P-loop ATPase